MVEITNVLSSMIGLVATLAFSLMIHLSNVESSKFRDSLQEIVAKTKENWLKIAQDRQKSLNFMNVNNFHTNSFWSSSDWSYERHSSLGPDNWYINYPKCGTLAQSPIDINPKLVTKLDSKDVLTLKNYDVLSSCSLNISENRFTISVPKGSTLSEPSIQMEYILIFAELHWGTDDDFGSEHTVGGRSFPLEVHFVHKLSTCCSSTKSNSIPLTSVLSVLFELNSFDNEHLNPLIRAIVNNKTNLLLNFFNWLPRNTDKYYRYMGSMTSPPCDGRVLWTVFREKQLISSHQLNVLRRLYDSRPYLRDNFRPTQYLNARKVFDSSSSFHSVNNMTEATTMKPIITQLSSANDVKICSKFLFTTFFVIAFLFSRFCR